MDPARTSPSIVEEPDDDASSVRYVRNIKRIMEKTKQRAPDPKTTHLQNSTANPAYLQQARAFLAAPTEHTIGVHSLDGAFLGCPQHHLNPENRSLYSLNEYASSSFYQVHQLDRPSSGQFETSFTTYDIDQSDTDNQPFEFVLPSIEEQTNKSPPFARRYFSNSDTLRDQDHQSADMSDSSEADLDSKWSWKNLKREFRLSHSESLFHLYQAKLQHSFFVALLILNIIINLGAIIPYTISKYHEINLCKYLECIFLSHHVVQPKADTPNNCVSFVYLDCLRSDYDAISLHSSLYIIPHPDLVQQALDAVEVFAHCGISGGSRCHDFWRGK